MRGIDISFWEQIRIFWRRDTEAVSHRLQFTVAALFAEHTKMIALDKKHINYIFSVFFQLGSIVFDNRAFRNRLRAGSLRPAVNENRADTTRAVRNQIFHKAKSWYVNTGSIGSFENRLARFAFYFHTVNCKSNLVAHYYPFIFQPLRHKDTKKKYI